MTKEAQDNIYRAYYNAGVEHALQKTAGISLDKFKRMFRGSPSATDIRRMLAGGPEDLGAFYKALGERSGGITGTLSGALGGGYMGGSAGQQLAEHLSASPELAATLMAAGGAVGGLGGSGIGNIAGRNLGALLGETSGIISGVPVNRYINNLLADPFKRVPGIRG